jgi:hypothetical protein
MNPERPAPQIGSNPEMHHSVPDMGSEHLPDNETSGETGHEKEQNIQRGDRPGPAPPPINVALPTPTVALPTPVQQVADDTAGPTIASDDDLIEKEWVDKAKQIISQTQNDPFKREKEIGKLQADYLKKRYGKELGVSN